MAEGGQNPAAFSYLLPINSHVIWWLTLMGNGWNPSLSSSLIGSTVNGATVKIRWCHHVGSPPTATIQHLTWSTSTACGLRAGERGGRARAREGDYQEEVWRNVLGGVFLQREMAFSWWEELRSCQPHTVACLLRHCGRRSVLFLSIKWRLERSSAL